METPVTAAARFGSQTLKAVTRATDQAEASFLRSMLGAIVTVRWLTWSWAAAVALLSWEHLRPGRGFPMVAMLAVMLAVTVATTWLVRVRPATLTHPATVLGEIVVAGGGLLVDGWVFTADRAQSLVWAWPAAGIVSLGVLFGARWATLSAVALGFASYFGDARTSVAAFGVAAASKMALYLLAAIVAGYVARRLRKAEIEVSSANARAEVARTLHDGVLQTLAVVQRRSDDGELVALAQEQDRELRDFLFGVAPQAESRTLQIALRETASTAGSRFGLRVDVVLADDLPELRPAAVTAVAGAVSEALTNVGKHADADRVVLYAEPDDRRGPSGVFCSVKDNGRGFDASQVAYGQGLRGSIEGRIHAAGGEVAIDSRPGRGTEVKVWIA